MRRSPRRRPRKQRQTHNRREGPNPTPPRRDVRQSALALGLPNASRIGTGAPNANGATRPSCRWSLPPAFVLIGTGDPCASPIGRGDPCANAGQSRFPECVDVVVQPGKPHDVAGDAAAFRRGRAGRPQAGERLGSMPPCRARRGWRRHRAYETLVRPATPKPLWLRGFRTTVLAAAGSTPRR
jgi:hypothetical protein